MLTESRSGSFWSGSALCVWQELVAPLSSQEWLSFCGFLKPSCLENMSPHPKIASLYNPKSLAIRTIHRSHTPRPRPLPPPQKKHRASGHLSIKQAFLLLSKCGTDKDRRETEEREQDQLQGEKEDCIEREPNTEGQRGLERARETANKERWPAGCEARAERGWGPNFRHGRVIFSQGRTFGGQDQRIMCQCLPLWVCDSSRL